VDKLGKKAHCWRVAKLKPVSVKPENGNPGYISQSAPIKQEISMELVKLGKKGQVTIPKAILQAIGLVDEAPLLVETSADGAIVLRPAAVYPIEIYSEQRIEEFERDNDATDATLDKVRKLLK
jgi:AbrB family looped-hinge helix DNA binding protein